MKVTLNTSTIADYRKFLAIKSMPIYSIRGHEAEFPDEYAGRIGMVKEESRPAVTYTPQPWLFDYQRDIAKIAIDKQKYAAFWDCGLGKTALMLEWCAHVRRVLPLSKNVLILSPLMVIDQTIAEAQRFYGDYPIKKIAAKDLQTWLDSPQREIGITNYDALRPDLTRGCMGALCGDETSMMKSMYGSWGTKMIELGKGLEWKLCLTGTPAPNDRIEYGNHAVFLDQFPTLNAFLARYFVNRGQTNERWELKPHALEPFYRSLAHWSIFMSNPSTYGWKDNTKPLPPINIKIHHIELTGDQIKAVGKETGELFASDFGGITSRSSLARIAKGTYKGGSIKTLKPKFMADLIDSFGDASSIVWCKYNDEQKHLAAVIPNNASIDGDTPHELRMERIAAFKRGELKTLISKPKILGFGLNLQIATEMVFSTLQDSYEEYYQAIKRANRYGSTDPLNVHIPLTELEYPMAENVLRKAAMIQQDTETQERIFNTSAKR